MTSTAFITHRDCWLHNMGAHHPESPERLAAINDRLIAAGLDMYLSFHDAPLATVDQVARAPPRAHVEVLLASVPAFVLAWRGLSPVAIIAASIVFGAIGGMAWGV